MLAVLGYLIVVVLVGLIAFFFYVESKRKREIEENKKAISRRVSSIKDKFKAELNGLVEVDIITVEQHNSFYQLANNFFIFQTIKKSTIEYSEFTFNNLIGALQHSEADKLHIEAVNEQVSIFTRLLPKQNSEHNAKFYRNKLPQLIEQFITAKQDIADVEKQLDIDAEDIEEDIEKRNEEVESTQEIDCSEEEKAIAAS